MAAVERVRPNLTGHYGFIADFSEMDPKKIEDRVQTMYNLGIREFQFYDWFADYSTPVRGVSWPNPFDNKRDRIHRATIEQYIKCIREIGKKKGKGIHNFLKRSFKLLRNFVDPDTQTPIPLKQTVNFVHLAWWTDKIVKKVEFPYAEIWPWDDMGGTNPEPLERKLETLREKDVYREYLGKIGNYIPRDPASSRLLGVLAYYPGKKIPNRKMTKGEAKDIVRRRLQETLDDKISYLIFGFGKSTPHDNSDPVQRLQVCYFPDTEPASGDLIGNISSL